MSIKLKWTLAFLFLVSLSLGLELIILHFRVQKDLEKHLVSNLVSQAVLLQNLVEQNLNRVGNLNKAAQNALASQAFDPSTRIRVARVGGEIVLDSSALGKPQGALPAESLVALGGADARWETSGYFYVAYPVRQFGEMIGVVECSASRSALSSTTNVLKRTFVDTALLASAVSVALAFAISGTLIRPIRELEHVARQIAGGAWRTRVSFHRGDELGKLAKTVHHMATELEEQFAELEGEKEMLQSLLASMIDGLIVLDEKDRIKFLNPQAERSLRTKSEAASGKTLEVVWPLKEVQDLVKRGLEESRVLSHELALPYNVLKLYVVPVPPVTGASAMLLFRDITEIRQLEEHRAQFLSQVSHELRTPLTIVKGYVITLLDDPRLQDAPDIKKILQRIEAEADRLTHLVEELLELSRLKAGEGHLTFAPVSLKELASDTLDSLRSHAERYQIQFDLHVNEEIPPVLGDSQRLKQVLINLLDNAMKYSPSGGKVAISLSRSSKGVSLEVIDHGSGIPKDDLPYIFERFFQGRKKNEGKGFGLGLPIVKEIVEQHQGRIEVESVENYGTRVVVTLPAEGLPTGKTN